MCSTNAQDQCTNRPGSLRSFDVKKGRSCSAGRVKGDEGKASSRRLSASPQRHVPIDCAAPYASSLSGDSSRSTTSISQVTVIPLRDDAHQNDAACYTSDDGSCQDNAIIGSNSNSSLASSDVFGQHESESVLSELSYQSSSTDSDPTETAERQEHDSQPLELHCFFHLFRHGELEQMITDTKVFRITKSYQSEQDSSWCASVVKL